MTYMAAVIALVALLMAYGLWKRGFVAPAGWSMGPVIRGKDYSKGTAFRDGGELFGFDFPQMGGGHAHAAIRKIDSLADATAISVTFEITGEGMFCPQEKPDAGATVSLMFQRRGDDWSAKGKYEFYRWYAPTVLPLVPGTHTLTANLDDPAWISVLGKPAADNKDAFLVALHDADSFAIVFGGGGSRAHGVYATKPATFRLLDWSINA